MRAVGISFEVDLFTILKALYLTNQLAHLEKTSYIL